MAIAWGDESIRRQDVDIPMYLVGVCICNLEEEAVLAALGPIKPHGARKLHWRDMRNPLKRQSASIIASMSFIGLIAVAKPLDSWTTEERARRKCFEALLPILEQEYEVKSLILESRDPTQDKRDRQFIDAIRGRGFIDSLRVEHEHGDSDARLWLPDQLLGAYGDSCAGSRTYDDLVARTRIVALGPD